MSELVELFEYKVDDLQAGKAPKGGLRSLRGLRRTLLEAPLPAQLLRRAVQAEKLYRQHQKGGAASAASQFMHPNRPWQAPITHNQEEAQAWHLLQQMLWHADMMRDMHEVTQALRSEPGRPTLRLLYALTENAERAERGIKTLFAVPPETDPLVSLNDAEVVRQLTDTLGDMLLLPDGEQRVWHALELLIQNPFPQNPEDELLQARLETMEDWGGSKASHNWAQKRGPQDRPVLRAAASRIEEWLAQQLAQRPQWLAQAVPAHSILYAQEPQCALSEPGEGDVLCIYLAGQERRTHWKGMRLSWRSLGPNWQLLAQDEALLDDLMHHEGHANGQAALLRPELPSSERRLTMSVGPHSLQVLFWGNYVLLRYRNLRQQLERLGYLAALGRGVALLLDPAEAYGHMRLARALAQRLRGGPIHVDGSHYTTMTPAERQASARRSLEALGQLLNRVKPPEVEHALHSAQAALNVPPLYSVTVHQTAYQVALMPETLTEAQTRPDGERLMLNPTGVFVWLPLLGPSLEVRLPGDRMLSLNFDYHEELVATVTGHVPVAVTDLQVMPLHDLTVIVVREGANVALCALPLLQPPVG